MDLGIGGTVAIVTGASRGIGKAIAMALAQEGALVAVSARNLGPLRETAAEIRARTQSKIIPIPADISRHEDVKRLVATTEDELGGVYILVNNAVAPRDQALDVAGTGLDLDDEEAVWLNAFNVKTLGYVRCARAVIDVMIRRGNGGRIVNIGGMVSRQVSYAGRKSVGVGAIPNASIPIITKNMSDLVAEHGITVNCIHPSHTRTPRQTLMIERLAESRGISVDEAEHSRAQNIPIGRMIEPDDVASLALFLTSDKASAITGQSIAVDGGMGRGMFL